MATKTKTKRAPKVNAGTAYVMIPTDANEFGFDTTANRLAAYRLLRQPSVKGLYFEDEGEDVFAHFNVYRLGPDGKEQFDLRLPNNPERDPAWEELTEALKGASFILTGDNDLRIELTHKGEVVLG